MEEGLPGTTALFNRRPRITTSSAFTLHERILSTFACPLLLAKPFPPAYWKKHPNLLLPTTKQFGIGRRLKFPFPATTVRAGIDNKGKAL
jgi:hypothetical protein